MGLTATFRNAFCTLCLFYLFASGSGLFAFSKAVAAEGRIVPAGGTFHVAVAPPQAVLAELLVQEGDWLAAGQPVAVVQGVPMLQAQVAAAQAAVQAAQESMQIAQQKGGIAELEAAKMVAIQREAEQQHTAAVKKVDANIIDLETVIDEKDPPKRDRAEIEFNIQQLEQEQIELLSVFPLTLARMQAEAAVVQAQSSLVDIELAVASAHLAAAQAKLALAQARLAEATVRAPRAGEVIEIFSHAGEAVGPRGILSMGNTRTMHVEAEVYVDDIAKVNIGDDARISGDGITDYFEGVVVSIARKVAPNELVSADPAAFTDQRVVLVTIELNEANREQAQRLLNLQVIARIKPPTHAQ